MKIVDKYVYPTSSRASIAGLRHYTVDGEEQKLPSVTTVIGQTQPRDKQESLDRWRQRVGLREAQKITRDAAIRGTAMHKYLEDLIRGERSLDLTEIGVEATRMAEIIVDHGLSYVDEVYGIEATLYYPGLYAGERGSDWSVQGQGQYNRFQTNEQTEAKRVDRGLFFTNGCVWYGA